jgi:guanylate kinase
VGKGTVVRGLLEASPDLVFSVSYTTREPRPGETEGIQYRFVTEDEFDALVRRDAFLEWAEVFGERYGTPAEEVARERDIGRDVLLEVDVQGAASVRSAAPDAVLVFLEPPSEEELARRLSARGTESGPAMESRLEEARAELAEASWFDHVVLNDRVEQAVEEVLAIIDASPHSEGDLS